MILSARELRQSWLPDEQLEVRGARIASLAILANIPFSC